MPPYQGKKKTTWYRGTANAIYQNINFIKRYNPEYVLILSGDHIYKMDYNKMLEFHKAKGSEATIAVIDVDIKEASRFGIMNTLEDGRIYEFEEKPANPKSTNASMGIYIFNAKMLYKYLEADEADENSKNDFGKNIIPKMLEDGIKMYAYQFSGYWKDVGTISSLWEANMDLLGEKPNFDIFDKSWKIYSRNDPYPPQIITEGATVNNSLITVGSLIEGTVINSLLGANVKVRKGAVVRNSLLYDGVEIREGATVDYSIIAENTIVKKNAHVGYGAIDSKKITVVASDLKIEHNVKILPGEMVEKDIKE